MKKTLLLSFVCILISNLYSQTVFIKNDKYGIKDSAGNIITKAKYDYIDDFEIGVTTCQLDGKYGIINSKGILIIEPIYDAIKPIKLFSSAIDIQLNGKWGVIDTEGKLVIEPKYYEPVDMSIFSQYSIVSLAKSVEVSSGKTTLMYGVIDNYTYKEIIKPKYVSIDDKGFGYFKVRIDEKYGLVDTTDKIIFEMKYDNIFAISNNIISYKKNSKWILVNSKGYSISSNEYENIFRMFGNRAKVRRNAKYGYIDEKGKEIIDCKYDEAENFYEEKAKVKLNDTKLEIDIMGQEITVSKTIKPRNTLTFLSKNDEAAFNLINFKENVSDSANLKLIDNYLSRDKNYLGMIASIDNLMSEAANNKIAYKEFTNYLYAKFLNSQYVCFDAIPIHVAKNYICNTDAPYGGGYWVGAQNKKDICEYGIKHKPSLCGEIVSDVSLKLLPQTNSNYFKLQSVKSKYTLLFFWKNECPYCEKQIKELVSNYEELKKLGVEIIGISLDENAKDKCEQLIVSYGMEWINTVDIGLSFSQKLNIDAVPNLFLLDEKKKIIYKKINVEQIVNLLK